MALGNENKNGLLPGMSFFEEASRDDRSVRRAAKRQLISLKALAERWACDRSTVRRNLQAAGIRAFLLGHGKRGIVRYSLEDVETYERRSREQ